MVNSRENWGSRLGFILAAAGSAIGLGNIWKFPYVVGQNGGAAFIFIYLICIAVIGLPVLIGEILIGRTAQRNPVGAFKALTHSKWWTAVGGMGVLAGFIILSYYSVISGWSLGYIYESVTGTASSFTSAADSNAYFGGLLQNVPWMLGMHALFMIICISIVLSGIQNGIEKASKIIMPLLFVLLIVLMIWGIILDENNEGLKFIFLPDWSKVSPSTILEALGQAFFTLSLGMGAMLTYGSYMSKKDNIFTSGLQIIFLDTFIAIVAGVAIFTSVFATGQNPAEGPGLIFQTLPLVFSNMPGGIFFAIIFFVLLTIAAITSAISLLEVVVAYFVDEKGWSRKKASVVFGIITFLIGIPSALSFNLLEDHTIFGLNFFGFMDYVSANVLLPLGGLLIAIFVGWVWGLDKVMVALKEGSEKLFEKSFWRVIVWKFFLRYLSPVLIFLVLLHSLGVF